MKVPSTLSRTFKFKKRNEYASCRTKENCSIIHILYHKPKYYRNFVLQSPIKGVVNPYDPHNFDEFYASEYGGWGGQQQGGGRDREGPNFGGRTGGRGGPPRGGGGVGGGR